MEEQDGSRLRRSNSLEFKRNKDKFKILNDDTLIVYKEQLESSAFSKKLEIAEVVELCFQPNTEEELGNILLKFLERLRGEALTNEGEISAFDGVCMFALEYVYEHDTVPFSAVLRSLFVYDWQNRLNFWGRNENLNIKCDSFVNKLRQFTDFHTDSKGEGMLVNLCLGFIATGNVGLSLYLVKFGLIEFPTEVNEKCKKMLNILVHEFNSFNKGLAEILQLDDMQISLSLEELLNKVKGNEINSRRSVLIFCILVVVAEYKMFDELKMKFPRSISFTEKKKDMCLLKFNCIDIYFEATTETMFTFQDIEHFIELFLNPFLSAYIRKSLLGTSKKLFGDEHHYYNPRSLQDLARVKVRSSLKNSTSIPKQVSELKLPIAVKKFLNFHDAGIWELLVANHINLSIEHQLSHLTHDIEDRNEQAIANDNVRELDDGDIVN